MTFNNTYFEDEVRDGFFVPSEIKRAWAAELEVLSEVDKICKKHHIQYFADWGTLLATVRHEGFIPWDDDLDIVMKRDDYNRFMEIAQTELPEGFSAYNFRNHDNLWLFLGRVVGKQRICFEEDHLERFHQFPYIAGVDIFVLDYVSRDKEAERKRDELALHTIALADMIGEGKALSEVMEREFCHLEQVCGIQITRGLSDIETRRELYGVVELLFGWFREEEADELSQLFPFGLKPDGFRISKKCYEQAVELPYENTRIPVPIQYCEMLQRKYGDYMRLVRDAGGHDYPFFEAQKKQLQAVLDFEMPGYKFTADQLECQKDADGYKEYLDKMSEGLQNNIRCISQYLETIPAAGPDDSVAETQKITETLQKIQQTAIDMGTLIEDIKGEGTQTVKQLEEMCETVYECSVALGQALDISEDMIRLQRQTDQIKTTLQAEITRRREVVFFVHKAKQWNYVEWYWQKVIRDAGTDVYVVPVPYDYKKYDGRRYDSQYEFDAIKKCVERSLQQVQSGETVNSRIADYRTYDVKLHHPEQIVIQNPCDEWNQAIILPEEYYSSHLEKYTEELVYIQSFQVEEFTKDNYREYHNMQYYCTMPGVVRADKVYVQSENMRDVYIQKLTEFAGKGTKQVWEKKVAVIDQADTKMQQKKNGRKRIAFYVQVGLTVQYKEEMLKKLNSVVDIFRENREKTELVWIGDREHDAFLQEYDAGFAEKYDAIREGFIQEGLGSALDRTDASVSEIVDMCDAYYGSGSHIALEFEVRKKPVMIMDVAVR